MWNDNKIISLSISLPFDDEEEVHILTPSVIVIQAKDAVQVLGSFMEKNDFATNFQKEKLVEK